MPLLATFATIVALAAGTAPQHVVTIRHAAAGSARVEYRATPSIRYRQLGAVAPGGRPSTLRCSWSADLIVDRVATLDAGTMLSRSFVRRGIVDGSRPGWCGSSRAVIEGEAGKRIGSTDRHVQAAAAADRPVLIAELDRSGPPSPAR
ncbi:hypothetical protein [Sphingomonas panni]|uniref:hypothetical protein n=1 Tax=Sphingomonas panni TaxID=237612 RepID=UPI001F5B777A|nr:hypothetical protein [Sphingomonas panni]